MGQPLLMAFWDDGKDNFENSALRFSLGDKPLRAVACVFAQISLGIQKTEADCHVRARASVAAWLGLCKGEEVKFLQFLCHLPLV